MYLMCSIEMATGRALLNNMLILSDFLDGKFAKYIKKDCFRLHLLYTKAKKVLLR